MRFISVAIVAVAGLFVGHVRGQFNDGLGLMNGLAPRSWPLAVAKPPLLGKRDGSCASGSHPCMRSTFAVVSDRFICFFGMRSVDPQPLRAYLCASWASAPMLRCVKLKRIFCGS